MTVPAVTVNKLCLSGLTAIAQAAAQVATGYSEIVVAGGMESMSNAPHLLPGARHGQQVRRRTVADALDKDGLVCGFDGISMGAATERYQAGPRHQPADQDAFAAESHARAAAAVKEGRLAEEIVPVATVRGRKGDVTVESDEGVRPGATTDELAALPAGFAKDGNITAGSASQLSDGACAVVVMSGTRATDLGLPWLAEIGALRHSRGARPVAAAPAGERDPGRTPPRRRARAPRHRRPGPAGDQRGVRRR